MKKLTEITCEDAIAILSKIYPLLFVNKFNENNSNNWKLINCDDIEPGCKKLFNENKIYCFYFYYDSIEIDYVNEESTNNIMTYFDVKYKCYIEAKLGYYIPELSELINKIIKMYKLCIQSDTDGDFRIDINLSTKSDFTLFKEEHKYELNFFIYEEHEMDA